MSMPTMIFSSTTGVATGFAWGGGASGSAMGAMGSAALCMASSASFLLQPISALTKNSVANNVMGEAFIILSVVYL